MVPAASAADLHDVHAELAGYWRHFGDLPSGAGLSGANLPAVTKNVMHEIDVLPRADRAGALGGVTVIRRGLLQVRLCITDFLARTTTLGELT